MNRPGALPFPLTVLLAVFPMALAAGCASLPLAPPEAQALKEVWAARRAALTEVQALADVQVHAGREAGIWPAFTAVFAYTAPDRIAISGYTTLGQPLFTYRAEGGRFTYRTPDGDEPVTGALDGRLKDPGLRLLRGLAHVLDGILGPEAGAAPLRVDREGRWVVRRPGETVSLTTVADRVTAVTVRHRSGERLRLDFLDFRDLGPVPAPHRIEAGLPALGARVEITVADWALAGPGAGAGRGHAAPSSPVAELGAPRVANTPSRRILS